jgi:G3E family GTPase
LSKGKIHFFSFVGCGCILFFLSISIFIGDKMNQTDLPIPVTVFTGFLGAGKTSIIQSLLSRIPNPDSIVILKNEFGISLLLTPGNAQTDSELLKSYKVAEMINGCLCCVLVGQIKTALLELKVKYKPERIIIETSGSAFPAPLSIQIREMPEEFSLDSIITVRLFKF